ncbi:MAG: thiol reductase thioredoxin [Oscillospiraceae bacterium]|nr:thiol reductase thioredoxin [Oscillospiraceae bacterium]
MIDLNRDMFNDYAIFGEKPIMVQFYAPRCTYCRRIEPVMEDLFKQYGDRLLMGRINLDKDPMLAAQEQIEAIPAMVIYKSGAALYSIVAPESKAEIEALIKEGING